MKNYIDRTILIEDESWKVVVLLLFHENLESDLAHLDQLVPEIQISIVLRTKHESKEKQYLICFQFVNVNLKPRCANVKT